MSISNTARAIALCFLGSVSLSASAAEEGIWSTENGELSAVIWGETVLLFEEGELEGEGKLIESGTDVTAVFDGEGEFIVSFSGDVLVLAQDGDQYQFNKQADRNRQAEAQLDGRWRIPGDASTKVFIDEGNIMLSNKKNGQMDSMDFGIYGSYWVNLPGPHGMSDTALVNFTYSDNSLVVTQDEDIVLQLQRK